MGRMCGGLPNYTRARAEMILPWFYWQNDDAARYGVIRTNAFYGITEIY